MVINVTTDKIKEMMDACYMAKRVRDLLPELPKGVAPSYIHYLDIIQKLESRNVKVKVSDISDALNLPRPGVTRAVKDMEMKVTLINLQFLKIAYLQWGIIDQEVLTVEHLDVSH